MRPVAAPPPQATARPEDWAAWFWQGFLPEWTARATDRQAGGFFDTLDEDGSALTDAPKTVLVQARLLFTFSHLALLSDDPAMTATAERAYAFLPHFRKDTGLYCRAVNRDGGVTGVPADRLARSYDQSFVILALSTWMRLQPSAEAAAELEHCWQAIGQHLTDPATGLLLEDDGVTDPAATDAPNRAQNPHMHLYEAALQAFEMTGQPRWLERASKLREVALRYFLDPQTGTVTEFLTPTLEQLPGKDGMRREPGHQCEWAWLLEREVELGGDPALRHTTGRLQRFAREHGLSAAGAMQGAAFDAAAADGSWRDETFLLWPQTEAIKAHVARHRNGAAAAAAEARALLLLMFRSYFAGRAAFVNQLDAEGRTLWPEALSRLLYHLVLALTEGARAGLWPGPTRIKNGGV